MTSTEKALPVKAPERIIDLDIIRGIALFGILVVNLELFAHPFYQYIVEGGDQMRWYDEGMQFFIRVFFEGKFITLFSFLFGLGFYIFTERLKAKKLPVRRVFLRRLFVLSLIGLAHGLMLWAGDILFYYSLGGMILLFFLYRKDKTIRIWMGIFVFGALSLYIIIILLLQLGLHFSDASEEILEGFTAQEEIYLEQHELGYEVYLEGNFRDILDYRLDEWVLSLQSMFMWPAGFPYVIAVFLFGFLIGRRGLLQEPAKLREIFCPKRRRNFIIGVAGSVPYAISYYYADIVMMNAWTILMLVFFFTGTPFLCMSYIGYILAAVEKSGEKSRLRHFAPVGRMALTNYLMQTIICTTLFYGYGFGLYGKLSPLMSIPLALAIIIVQILYSRWYLNRYSMGPLERLWRMATYMKRV